MAWEGSTTRRKNTARSSTAYQRFRAAMRRVHAAHAHPCALCREPIDYSLRYPNTASWSLDHIVGLHDGGALLDPANAQAAHWLRNSRRGAREGNSKRKAMRQARKAAQQTQEHTSTRW